MSIMPMQNPHADLIGSVGNNQDNHYDDVRRVKGNLFDIGYLDHDTDSPDNPIYTRPMDVAIKNFQGDNNLKIDGILKPKGETEQTLSQHLRLSSLAVKKPKKEAESPNGYDADIAPLTNQPIQTDATGKRIKTDLPEMLKDVKEKGGKRKDKAEFSKSDDIAVDAIRPLYPELYVLPAAKILKIRKLLPKKVKTNKKTQTIHSQERSLQRKISNRDIDKAKRSAIKSKQVSQKKGKYGTVQNVYKGKNGVTVIEETEGRNAGKVISQWRHN